MQGGAITCCSYSSTPTHPKHRPAQVVRLVSSSGDIYPVAGNGSCTVLGDGLPATAASITFGFTVAWDPAGGFWISETVNCVRRVDKLGIISTVAGVCGVAGYLGDGGAAVFNGIRGLASDGRGGLFIVDTYNHWCARGWVRGASSASNCFPQPQHPPNGY